MPETLSSAPVTFIKITYHKPGELAAKCFMAAPGSKVHLRLFAILLSLPPFHSSLAVQTQLGDFLCFMIESMLIGDEN